MLALDFSSAIPNTVLDKDDQGTGFTSVQSNKNSNQYDPSRIDLDPLTGALVLTATKGSNANNDNTLKNALQVGLDATEPFIISTRLLDPFDNLTTAYQQGGIYLGSNQDNYAKLVGINITQGNSGKRIQFYQEQQGAGSTVDEITGLNWSNIETLDLFLAGDPVTNKVTAGYRINSDTAAPKTFSKTLKPKQVSDFFGGEPNDGRAGVLAFTKNAADVPITFDSFGIAQDVKVNFQTEGATLPPGYIKDSGKAYSNSRGYGWITQGSVGSSTPTPLDISIYGRDRNRAGVEQRLDTLMHMQYPNTPSAAAAWEYAVPNGTYSVTVSVGHQRPYDSRHTINVEGVNLINKFRANSKQEYQLATSSVTVADGRLTVDAIGGTNTKINYLEIDPIIPGPHPQVTKSAVTSDSTGVYLDTAVSLDVAVATEGAGVDATTLTTNNVQLYRTKDNDFVEGVVNTTGGGDAIVYQPSVDLAPNTSYTFRVTDGVRDEAGDSFIPYSTTFNTGINKDIPTIPEVKFAKSRVYQGKPISTLLFRQDKLYASTLDGQILRWNVASNGILSNLSTYSPTALQGRAIIGAALDPNDSKSLYLWSTNNDPLPPPPTEDTPLKPAKDFTSKLSKITVNASNFKNSTITDYVVGLPRSAKDHLSNSLAFGKDGKLYMSQGSNTAMGAPDDAWFNRPERLLSASILQIDPTLTPPAGGFNVQTQDYYEDGQLISKGNYNPYAANAPVKLFATGIRNAYDLVWHSNGYLYTPTNGSAAGGNTPNNPSTSQNEALTDVATQNDYLFKIDPNGGGYYGHPNPTRGEYILNGGNPTSGVDPAEVVAQGKHAGYSVGINPDSNYRGFAYDFGRSRSPNGVIEYKSTPAAFGDALKGQLLVVEYSAGDSILALDPGVNGNIAPGSGTRIASGFTNPLDLIENQSNGNLYVAGLSSDATSGEITLLQPTV